MSATIPWLEEMTRAFVAAEAHCFVLHGDVNGYVERGVSPVALLCSVLATRKDGTRRIIVRYDRARGIRFSDDDRPAAPGQESQRARATRAITADATPPAGGSPAAQALLAAGGMRSDPFSVKPPGQALNVLDDLIRVPALTDQVVVIVEESDKIIPDGEVSRISQDERTMLVLLRSWARDVALANSGNMVILMTEELIDLHVGIRSPSAGWRAVELPLPDEERRRAWLDDYLVRNPDLALVGMTVPEMARLTAGLNLYHLEDIMLRGAYAGGVTPALMGERKAKIISDAYRDVVAVIDPLPGGLSAVGGLDSIKDYLRSEVVDPIEQGNLRKVKRGLMLVGPPGNGKTMLIQALAQDTRMNAIAVRTEKVQEGIVGASERNLARLLAFARALAPTILFIDEIDQTDMGQRGNASGNPVAKNLFQMMLTFMSDPANRGKVIVVFASNRPDLLDPALIRSQRIDKIIPIMPPDEAARARVVRVTADRFEATLEDGLPEHVAARTAGYSAADVTSVMDKAIELALREGDASIIGAVVEIVHADAALRYIRPVGLDRAAEYTRYALDACNDLELLPEEYRQQIEARAPRGQSRPDQDGGRRRRNVL